MYEFKVMHRDNRAIIVETFLKGHLTESQLREAMQLYVIAKALERLKWCHILKHLFQENQTWNLIIIVLGVGRILMILIDVLLQKFHIVKCAQNTIGMHIIVQKVGQGIS